MANFDVTFHDIALDGFIGCAHVGFFSSGTTPDTTDPVVSAETPADGSQLSLSTTAIGFDVTDTGGNLSRTTIHAFYPTTGVMETVYFGSSVGSFTAGFAPYYYGTRTAIANGFRFAGVVRRGGWPAAPQIIIDAGDSAGNEN